MKPFWRIKSTDPRDALFEYLDLDISVFPVGPHKSPLVASWLDYQSRIPTQEEAERWAERLPHMQLAFVTGAINGWDVVDFDHPKAEEWWFAQGYPDSLIKQRTRRGTHRFYRHTDGTRTGKHFGPPLEVEEPDGRVTVSGRIDVRANGGYVIIAPSVIADHRYVLEVPRGL